MAQGTIITLTERGFGFIRPAQGGADVFFHRLDLDGVAFEDLRRGDAVTYSLEADRHHPRMRAVAVRRVRDAEIQGGDDERAARP